MSAKIIATPMAARDLKPGDLFSIASQDYWDKAMDHGSCGECVYVRTNADADAFGDADSTVYRITIEWRERSPCCDKPWEYSEAYGMFLCSSCGEEKPNANI